MATERPLPPIQPVTVDDLEQASQAGRFDLGSAALRESEQSAIDARRARYGLLPASDDNTFGLALSGGGIRSASFALGVLQALAKHDVLKHVDYLSTVSGGGYIGSSLQWWLSGRSGRTFGVRPYRPAVSDEERAAGLEVVPENERFPYGTDDPSLWRDRAGQVAETRLLRNLKEKGNYLTPGGGINMMSLLGVVLRGVALNLLFWVPLLTVLLGTVVALNGYDVALWLAIGLVLLFVLASILYSLATGFRGLARRLGYLWRRRTERYAGVLITIALVAALTASIQSAHVWLIQKEVTAEQAEARAQADSRRQAGPAESPTAPAAGHPPQGQDDRAQSEAGADQLAVGLIAGLGGVVAGLVTFFRTMRGVIGRVRKIPSVTTDVIAVVAAGLIIYGVLLFCHGLAVVVIENDLMLAGLLLAAFSLFVSVWVNVNHISVHRMYRDRLMEAFMPGFEEARKGRSRAAPAAADGMKMHDVNVCNGPLPIINTNLLLVQSKERRRRLRGGENFILTPGYCGSNATGWVDCRQLMGDRMTVPTAMAISGAAANPNTGVGGVGLTRNRLIAVLMAFIGLRLGYWIPALRRGRLPFWLPNHVWPGLGAVLPLGHHEESWFLELTDGGHFENLGIYELVRRRPRLIVVCDGAQDADFAFEDLQGAQRRIAADFGARLDLQVDALERLVPKRNDRRFPEQDLKLAEAGHAVGTICYADGSTATLLYLKTTLVEDLPLALLGYRGANRTFPDEPTTDQFFDEEQFEAYRELGFIIAERMMADDEVRPHLERVLGPNGGWEAVTRVGSG